LEHHRRDAVIGDRELPRTDDPAVALERAKAIWAFRTTELVDELWDFIEQRDNDPVLAPTLDDLRELLAGDEHPRPPRKVTAAYVRPAVPPASRICTDPVCPCGTGGQCQKPVWERELIAEPRTEPGA
jgi:hypothetical protein